MVDGPAIDKSLPFAPDPTQKPPPHTANPCKEREFVGIQDYPALSEPVFDPVTKKRWSIVNQRFETCAICIEGKEGMKIGAGGAVDTLFVYGCIPWKHDLTYSALDDSYRVRRTLKDTTKRGRLDTPMTIDLGKTETLKPSAFFIKGIKAYPKIIGS